MARRNRQVSWELIQTFAAVAGTGSLAAASTQLGVSQATTSRRIAALEADFGTRLFGRTTSGMELTAAGRDLSDKVAPMVTAAAAFSASSHRDGAHEAVETIRISVSRAFATIVLPGMLKTLRGEGCAASVEIIADDRVLDVTRREADIAIRFADPTEPSEIARRVGVTCVSAFCSEAYAEGRHIGSTPNELLRHTLIGLDDNMALLKQFRAAGVETPSHAFAYRCDDFVVNWRLAQAGLGITFGFDIVGLAVPGLHRIPLPALQARPVWLSAHQDMRGRPVLEQAYKLFGRQLGKLVSRPR